MPNNLGNVSVLNINGNELIIKDAALTEIVNEIIEAIGANNTSIGERINDLHSRSFDAEIKISSANETEISNIVDGLYKLQYVTITGEGTEATETLNNSAILIQKGTNQYLIKDGQLLSRTKTNDTWGTWTSAIVNELSSEYEMSSASNEDLALESGDTYEEAFSKIEKTIIDNEYVTAAALNDLNNRVNEIPTPVKPDWEAASGSDAEILNKPDLSNFLTIETQPNWNETNTSSAAYIKNKPDLSNYITKSNTAGLIQNDGTIREVINVINEIPSRLLVDINYNYMARTDYSSSGIILTSEESQQLLQLKQKMLANNAIFMFNNTICEVVDVEGLYNSGEMEFSVDSMFGYFGTTHYFSIWSENNNIQTNEYNTGDTCGIVIQHKKYLTTNDIPTTSTSVTQNDTNPVSGGAVYTKFADLIGSAPTALDTLQEIATALNNDADLAGTLTTQISSKVPKVSNPTTDNFASFNSDGTIKDSGHSHSDYITSIKTVNNESLVGTGNIVISGLPQVSATDNGKILMVVNGQWQLVSPSALYTGQGVPNNSQGNNGDLYLQTD